MSLLDDLLPYKSLPLSQLTPGDDYLVKFQGMASHHDKQLLITVFPDRGLFTLLLQSAIKQTADYVRTNNLTYSPESTRALLKFICGGPFTCTAGQGGVGHVAGGTAPVLQSPPSSPDQPADVHEGTEGRSTKKVRQEKIRLAAKRTKRGGVE